MAMDPGGDRVIAGPAAGVGPGEEEEGRQHSQIGGREPGVGGDVVGDGGEGDTRLVLGPPGALSPRPIRGAAAGVEHRVGGQFTGRPRRSPASIGALETGAGIGEHGPQYGEGGGPSPRA